jgi:acetyl-CoA carboxylase biotin carboxyl carrier protein
MDLQRIEALLKLLSTHDVSDFHYRDGEVSLRLRLGPPPPIAAPVQMMAPAAAAPVHAAPAAQAAATPVAAAPAAKDPNVVTVDSPMVGTFYRTPSPGAPPFVEVGSTVKIGQPLCIVEAMKLMNEIESEVAGTVVEILVESGHPVQFGQALFKVRKG